MPGEKKFQELTKRVSCALRGLQPRRFILLPLATTRVAKSNPIVMRDCKSRIAQTRFIVAIYTGINYLRFWGSGAGIIKKE
jgi:hypothetical protein